MFSNQMSVGKFYTRLITQIKEEGWSAVQRKARHAVVRKVKLPNDIIVYLLTLSMVLFVRLIKPFVFIRFGPVRSDVIGHSVFNPEYYLCDRELNNYKTIDCFYFQSYPFPNEQWALMVRRHLRINPFFKIFDKVNRTIPGWEKHFAPLIPFGSGSRDINGLLSQTKPHIRFTNEENSKGINFLQQQGLNSKDKFICLIVRDSAYKEKYQNQGGRDWSYHNYRDVDIDTYKATVLALAKKGYWVFRMGKAVHKPLKEEHPRILDYANSSYRSDFLDIWLMANCFFCISNSTGLDEVSGIFKKPVVKSNMVPIQYMASYSQCITVPKYLVYQDNNRLLTFSDHLAHSYLRSEEYDRARILVQDLTSKEIKDAALEMEARLTGSWEGSKQDLQFQQQFWEKFKQNKDFNKFHGWIHPEARIGASFLRENHEWFLA